MFSLNFFPSWKKLCMIINFAILLLFRFIYSWFCAERNIVLVGYVIVCVACWIFSVSNSLIWFTHDLRITIFYCQLFYLYLAKIQYFLFIHKCCPTIYQCYSTQTHVIRNCNWPDAVCAHVHGENEMHKRKARKKAYNNYNQWFKM